MKKIYILHGWTYSMKAWDALVALLSAQGIECVQLAVPGLTGESSEVWNVEKYVAWLKDELETGTLSRDPVVLIGHSNGGRIALAFAAKYPERVEKLVLIDAAGIIHNELLLELKRAVLKAVAQTGKYFVSSPFLRKAFYRLIGARDYERAPLHMRETMKNLLAFDITPELHKVTAPTLIIWGKQDTATPVSDAYTMHEGIKNSKLHIISDAGHSPHATHPQRMMDILLPWLA